nr:tripartite tricarboxylate transporter substrate binding protein [Ramlibacter aurantiacus]
MDTLGRALATSLGETLGQPFVVENRPGAAGQIASEGIAKAVGDPHQLLMGSLGIMGISPFLYPNLPYDVKRDFTPVALCAAVPYALVINPRVVPVNTVAEFLQWARSQKTPTPYASVGSGSVSHVCTVALTNAAGISLTQVAYRQPSQIVTDMVKGDMPMIIDTPSPYLPFAADGRLRILAVTSPRRMSILPNVPTMAEAGVAGYDVVSWFGLYAPRDLPPASVDTLRTHVARALRSPKLREQFLPQGLEITPDGAADFAAFNERERTRWQAFIQRNEVKLDKM